MCGLTWSISLVVLALTPVCVASVVEKAKIAFVFLAGSGGVRRCRVYCISFSEVYIPKSQVT